MTPYEAMVQTSRRIIRYGADTISAEERRSLVPLLLSARSSREEAMRFYTAVRFPGNRDAHGRRMYPEFMIPPYNAGKKYKTILGQTPGTYILSANGYELEILRLLWLLAPTDPEVRDMNDKTVARLRHTCFANEDDGVGECFDTNLIALRYLGTVCPENTGWIRDRIGVFHRHFGNKKRPWQTMWMFYLCLSELPDGVVLPELERYRTQMIRFLREQSCVMRTEEDRAIQPVLFCILRNCAARDPAYAHIREMQPFTDDKDGRLRFPTF
ncbi:MAG: hypothetical protein IJ480_02235 [Clostridia bacterium]|nr:hypothetical protein [Clostridia bacterium]